MQHNYIPLSDKSRPPLPHEEYIWFGTAPEGHYYVKGYKSAAFDIVIDDSGYQHSMSEFIAYQPLLPPHNFWCRPEFVPVKRERASNVVEFKRPVKVGRTL